MIIDNYFNKFNINKLNRTGGENNSSEGTVYLGGSTSNQSSSGGGANGFIPRYLWGQYFDDTKDINGDLGVQGDITFTGNIAYNGQQGSQTTGFIQAPKMVADTMETRLLHSTNIINEERVLSDTVEANLLIGAQGQIDSLTSQDIYTHNLTVTGQAHFFELVIDKITHIGGAVMLAPADGFKIEDVQAANYTYGGSSHSGIKFLWLAKDNDGNSTNNMWQVDDQLLVKDFDAATIGQQGNAGTQGWIGNRYLWAIVREVGTTVDGEYHYVIISKETGEYDGTLPYIPIYEGDKSDFVGADAVMCGNRSDATRQNVIYITTTDSLDTDIRPPFIAMYRGVNDFSLSSHRYTWFSSGAITSGTAANRLVGELLVEAGGSTENIVDYVDDLYANTQVDQYTVEMGTNQIFIPADNNAPYNLIGTGGQWETTVALYNNGLPWTLDFAPTSSFSSGITFTPDDDRPTQAPHYKYKVTIQQSIIPSYGWTNLDPYPIDVTLTSHDNDNNTITRTVYIYLNKSLKGANGSATTVNFDLYELIPVIEQVNVTATGVMKVNLKYQLGAVNVDQQGNTYIDPLATWPSDISCTYCDDHQVTTDVNLTDEYVSGNVKYKVLTDNSYTTDYVTKLTNNTAPTYMTIKLKNNGNVITQRTVPVVIYTGAVFDLKDDAIRLAVSGAQTLIDTNNNTYGLTTVANNVSQLSVQIQGIQGTVAGVQTTVDQQGQLISQKVDTSVFNQTAQGLDTRVTSIENTYLTSNEYYSSIQQTANQISATVASNIDGQLQSAGINITTNKITLDAANTVITGNLAIGSQGAGISFKDANDNNVVEILNEDIPNRATVDNYQHDITKIGNNGMFSKGTSVNNNDYLLFVGGDGIFAEYGNNKIAIESNGIKRSIRIKTWNGNTKTEDYYSGTASKDISSFVNMTKITPQSGANNYNLDPDDGFVMVYSGGYPAVQLNLPDPSSNAGCRIFIRSYLNTTKITGPLLLHDGTTTTEKDINDDSTMWLCDGSRWVLFDCYYDR